MERSWYEKKRYLIPGGLFGVIFALGALGGGSSPQATSVVNTAAVVSGLPATEPVSGTVALPNDSNKAPAQAVVLVPDAVPTSTALAAPVVHATPVPTPVSKSSKQQTHEAHAASPRVDTQQVVVVPPTPVYTPTPTPEPTPLPTPEPAATLTPVLSNDTYYTNVDGNSIHAPVHSDSIPTGASAKCRDGSYSFSQHRSGTCSHHGGVSQWY